jgi:hypothetical protein
MSSRRPTEEQFHKMNCYNFGKEKLKSQKWKANSSTTLMDKRKSGSAPKSLRHFYLLMDQMNLRRSKLSIPAASQLSDLFRQFALKEKLPLPLCCTVTRLRVRRIVLMKRKQKSAMQKKKQSREKQLNLMEKQNTEQNVGYCVTKNESDDDDDVEWTEHELPDASVYGNNSKFIEYLKSIEKIMNVNKCCIWYMYV